MGGRAGKRKRKRKTRGEMGRQHERKRKKLQKSSNALIIGHAIGKPWFVFLGALFNKSNWSQEKSAPGKQETPSLQFQYLCVFFLYGFLMLCCIRPVPVTESCNSVNLVEKCCKRLNHGRWCGACEQ